MLFEENDRLLEMKGLLSLSWSIFVIEHLHLRGVWLGVDVRIYTNFVLEYGLHVFEQEDILRID